MMTEPISQATIPCQLPARASAGSPRSLALAAGNDCYHPARITFAIPYYSGRDYLQRAVASVLRQRVGDWELFVCDDCGPELGADELLASYRDPRLKYVRNERRLGMAGNWNRCLDAAQTELVTVLHADDELRDSYAETMLAAADEYPQAAAFFCNAVIIDEASSRCFSFPDFFKRVLVGFRRQSLVLKGETALRSVLRGNFIMCPTLCYRKSILGSRRFAPRWRFVQDLDLTTRLLLDGETLVGLPAFAYAYRRHGENATLHYTRSLLRFDEELRLYDEVRKEALARGWNRAARVAGRKAIIKLNLAYCALQDVCRLRCRRAAGKAAFLARTLVN